MPAHQDASARDSAAGAPLGRLTRRPQFLAVADARRKWVAPGLILQARRHDDRQRPAVGEAAIRFGLTASRKVGNAVIRNRARRRLRAAAQEVLSEHAAPGHDFVLIARAGTPARAFGDLKQDLAAGLKRLGVWRDRIDAVLDAAAQGGVPER